MPITGTHCYKANGNESGALELIEDCGSNEVHIHYQYCHKMKGIDQIVVLIALIWLGNQEKLRGFFHSFYYQTK